MIIRHTLVCMDCGSEIGEDLVPMNEVKFKQLVAADPDHYSLEIGRRSSGVWIDANHKCIECT